MKISRRLISGILVVFGLGVLVAARATAPSSTAQNIQLSSQMVFGLQNVYPNTIFQYQEPSTTTAQFSGSTAVTIPANSTDNVVDTATLFPAFGTPVCFGLHEVTSPALPLNIGLSAGGPRIQMNAAGFMIFRVAAGNPVFYVDNPSATDDAALQVFGMSN